MKSLVLLLLAVSLRPAPALADARGDLDGARTSSGWYDGRRGGGDYYYDRRGEYAQERRDDAAARRRAAERDERFRNHQRGEPPAPGNGGGGLGFGQTGVALAAIGGGAAAGFLTMLVFGTGPFGLIGGFLVGVAAAIAIGYYAG